VIDVYAITEDGPATLPAAEGADLRMATADGLAAVWAPAPDAREAPEVTLDAIRRHEAIVEALMADRDLLPLRFGSRVDDASAAERLLHTRHDELARALSRVRGTAEVAVRVVAAPGATADPDRALEAVHRPLVRRARAATCRGGAGNDLLRGAYLVPRDEVTGFAVAVGKLQEACPDLRLLCTGPWPPYSFSD
jgi:hypothetical protein